MESFNEFVDIPTPQKLSLYQIYFGFVCIKFCVGCIIISESVVFSIRNVTKLLPVTSRAQVAKLVSKGSEFQSGT